MSTATSVPTIEEVEAEFWPLYPPEGGSQPLPQHQEAGRPILRTMFTYINRYLMVPVFRLGLGRAIGSPIGGYIMVLKTIGKKSGNTRHAPLNYAILDGNVYCIAGWARTSHWFANLKADPHVEMLMPGGALAGIAEEVGDPREAELATVQVARNAGFATLFEGINPLSATDAQILQRVGQVPVVRIRPIGLGSGPSDPGGWGWVLPLVGQGVAILWLVNQLRPRRRSRVK